VEGDLAPAEVTDDAADDAADDADDAADDTAEAAETTLTTLAVARRNGKLKSSILQTNKPRKNCWRLTHF